MFKKIYITLLILFSHYIVASNGITQEQQFNVMLSNYNVQAFADNIYIQPSLQPERFVNWIKISNNIKDYVLKQSTDLFNKQDSTLTAALEMLEKANISLITGIIGTYKYARTTTSTLAFVAQKFKKLADDVQYIINYLKKTTFFLNKKKNARQMLILWAKYIEANAEKQAKDLRNSFILLSAGQPIQKKPTQKSLEEIESENIPEVPKYIPSLSSQQINPSSPSEQPTYQESSG